MWVGSEVFRKTRLYISEHPSGLKVPNFLILRRVILLHINMQFRRWITLLFCCEVCRKFKWKTPHAVINSYRLSLLLLCPL